MPTNIIADTDSKSPELTSSSLTSETFGFGHNTCVSSNIYDNESGIDIVKINITYPDNSYVNTTMNNTQGAAYESNFTDSWLTGQYNYTIWVKDNANNTNITTQRSFNISVEANITISTIKDIYYDNETINLTDPPSGTSELGYELLDDGDILHMWNQYDSYYFNTSSGIQLTNHYDDYWSHNVLMLGYYNNDMWNLIYRTDELSGFNRNVDSDDETFVNATIWKDLTYNGYDFRLAIRYHLGVDDNELTVIPYIKNIDEDNIPYVLGFGWEIKDIRIADTIYNNSILINCSEYQLNQTLDLEFTNLTATVTYWNETTNQSENTSIPNPMFVLRAPDPTYGHQRTLYLKWNESLNYLVRVKSRTGQYNAPTTLFIKIGTLEVNQEKYTKIYWLDSSTWTNPDSHYDYGDGYPYDWENEANAYDDNTWISAGSEVQGAIGGNWGGFCSFNMSTSQPCNKIRYYVHSETHADIDKIDIDVSRDGEEWTDLYEGSFTERQYIEKNISGETEVGTKCMRVRFHNTHGLFTRWAYLAEVDFNVINAVPTVSDEYPSSGSIGIPLNPVLNITIYDDNPDKINITWLSNSSGSWQVFGTNNSVETGTYHQAFSNASVNGQWWYWKVNVSDGKESNESSVYKFYTGHESKLENTGSTNISGYLTIQVQYYSNTTDHWVVDHTTIKENTTRTIPAGGYLALDTIFNGKVNASNLIFWNGTYRVYAALCDPDGNVLRSNDESLIFKVYTFQHLRAFSVGWHCLESEGFERVTNIATRGATVYNNELYVGTESYNKQKIGDNFGNLGFAEGTKITMADNSLVNIEDLDIEDVVKAYDIGNSSYVNASVISVFHHPSESNSASYVKINNDLYLGLNQTLYINQSFIQAQNVVVGNNLKDVNLSNVTVSSTQDKDTDKPSFYHIELSVDPDNPVIPNNLTYFANDIQAYQWTGEYSGTTNVGMWSPFWVFRYLGGLGHEAGARWRAGLSDGCELWKYNYANNVWTELIGPSQTSDEPAGFGTTDNIAISGMVEFNGDLYVGTWNTPDNGCQIWRYDGSDWEQVIGPDAVSTYGTDNSGGFDNEHNMGISCFKVFENSDEDTHLYAGTINLNWGGTNGRCELWRTTNGEDWDQIVDGGFIDFGAGSNALNVYLWSLEEFDGDLYAGTFNFPFGGGQGCQLYRSDTGNDDDWDKITLLNGETSSPTFADGFGHGDNYGIREMVNWNGYLYVGVAADAMGGVLGGIPEAIEIWRFDGTNNDYGAWECIVGDDSDGSGTKWKDGFGDTYNKYPWSMALADNKLWIGTSNVQWVFEDFAGYTNGCEVWCYDGTSLDSIVEDNDGEIESGFMEVDGVKNGGARSMAEYPKDSGNIVVGTMRVNSYIWKSWPEYGCQVWIRED